MKVTHALYPNFMSIKHQQHSIVTSLNVTKLALGLVQCTHTTYLHTHAYHDFKQSAAQRLFCQPNCTLFRKLILSQLSNFMLAIHMCVLHPNTSSKVHKYPQKYKDDFLK